MAGDTASGAAPTRDTQSASPRPYVLTALADIVAIVVFVVIGRFNHDDGVTVTGVLHTAEPFLIGGAAGWALCSLNSLVLRWDHRERQFSPWEFRNGVVIWVAVVALGMTLRWLFGDGIAVSFIIVATIALGLFLLLWRGAATLLRRRAQAR